MKSGSAPPLKLEQPEDRLANEERIAPQNGGQKIYPEILPDGGFNAWRLLGGTPSDLSQDSR